MTGSLSPHDHPGDHVRLTCDRCERAGQYRKRNLIKQFGAEIALPDLRHEIAKCERRGQMHDMCAIHFVDLVPKS
jgi:hypothetical protein